MGKLAEDTGVYPVPRGATKSPEPFTQPTPLMVKIREGDRPSFNLLCRRYVFAVASYFRRTTQCGQTIDDLTQEVFSRVWENRARYRPGTPDSPYLQGYARMVLREYQAKRLSQRRINPRQIPVFPQTDQASVQDQAEIQEQIQSLKDLMASLPKKQRQAMELVYLCGLSSREVSEMLGCSDKTIRSYCCRGLTKLKVWLGTRK